MERRTFEALAYESILIVLSGFIGVIGRASLLELHASKLARSPGEPKRDSRRRAHRPY